MKLDLQVLKKTHRPSEGRCTFLSSILGCGCIAADMGLAAGIHSEMICHNIVSIELEQKTFDFSD